jgi:hypothetical protein
MILIDLTSVVKTHVNGMPDILDAPATRVILAGSTNFAAIAIVMPQGRLQALLFWPRPPGETV